MMTCRSSVVIIRRVEVAPDGRLGADYVTLGTLRNGLNRTRRAHLRLVDESAPLSEREARKRRGEGER